jgi:uncharacterized membrane protein YraQ (UPF0718 family)
MTDNAVERFLVIFISIFFEALPFIALGAVISGALEELLPQGAITRLLPRRRTVAVAVSALLGLIFPMCECGIVPVMRRLLRKGLPLSCAIAYMLAAPVINPVVMASTWAAFSGDRSGLDGLTSLQMVSLRVGLAFLTAFTVAHVVHWADRRYGLDALLLPIRGVNLNRNSREYGNNPAHDPPGTIGLEVIESPSAHTATKQLGEHHSHSHPHEHGTMPRTTLTWRIWFRLVNIAEIAIHDFLEITCFLILGATLAAIVQSADLLSYAPMLKNSPALAVSGDDASGRASLPVQRGGRICCCQPDRHSFGWKARFPGAGPYAGFEAVPDVHSRLSTEANLDDHRERRAYRRFADPGCALSGPDGAKSGVIFYQCGKRWGNVAYILAVGAPT